MLAAPDVDRDVFKQEEPNLAAAFSGVTLYASSKDWALKLSETLARDFARAGDVPPLPRGPIVLPHM
ncbi:MAG: alpha/beta hydrolase [Xanthobacteraceae bacterium]